MFMMFFRFASLSLPLEFRLAFIFIIEADLFASEEERISPIETTFGKYCYMVCYDFFFFH